MIIAGPCLFVDDYDAKEIYDTSLALRGVVDMFRCKLWGGGTLPIRYFPGVGARGLPLLETINQFLPAGTEVQTPEHVDLCGGLDFLWIGARNSQNYALLEAVAKFKGSIFIKRGFGMTINETMGLFDIMKAVHSREVYIVERGVTIFDRLDNSRWSPDLEGVLRYV